VVETFILANFAGRACSVVGAIERHDYAMFEWHQPTATGSPESPDWAVLHFDGDLIDHAIMFIQDGR
jgi:hypothetical protein